MFQVYGLHKSLRLKMCFVGNHFLRSVTSQHLCLNQPKKGGELFLGYGLNYCNSNELIKSNLNQTYRDEHILRDKHKMNRLPEISQNTQ
jgi:hypothetical protein